MEREVLSIVIGRRFFIDLWGILGMVPLLCEDPSDLPSALPEILSRKDVGCVMVEEKWFQEIPLPLKNKLESMETPLWVSLPTLMIGDDHL